MEQIDVSAVHWSAVSVEVDAVTLWCALLVMSEAANQAAFASGVRAATSSSSETTPPVKSRTESMNFGGTPSSAI
jgi:hypothetical protein